MRRNKKAADTQDDYLNELLEDPANAFSDADDAPPAAQENDADEINTVETKQVKRKTVIDDDDDDVDGIFNDD